MSIGSLSLLYSYSMAKLWLIWFFLLFAIPTPRAEAAGEFATVFESVYQLRNDGQSQVTHTINLTNKLAHIYTTEYTISFSAAGLKNLRVLSEGQPAPYDKSEDSTHTNLTITIPNPVIGKDQELNLEISYLTQGILESYGQIKEVNIPRLSRANEAERFVRRIIVPAEFGNPDLETPHSTTKSTNEQGDLVLDYVGYPNDSLTLFFGRTQSYRLNLQYFISNISLTNADTEIALPPDTEYQKIILDSIDPRPNAIKVDADGNWLAVYSLKGQEKKEINATLYLETSPVPVFLVPALLSDSLLKSKKYWDVNHAGIKTLAGQLQNPQNIYDYLVSNLDYAYSRVGVGAERLGAIQALENPDSAICTEFTDAFIALSRAAGFQARENNGYAYTSNSQLRPVGTVIDILHSWPEYYDPQASKWIQIDPTWGKTTGGIDYFGKMDYGHLTFVRHGHESAYPYPAGAYKTDASQKTINVELADSVPAEKISYTEKPTAQGTLITNIGNTALRDYPVTMADGSTLYVSYLPPLASQELKPESQPGNSFVERFWLKLLSLFRRS